MVQDDAVFLSFLIYVDFVFQTFKDPDTSTMSTIPLLNITREDTECLKDAFALFDADKDGEITTKELAKVKHERLA